MSFHGLMEWLPCYTHHIFVNWVKSLPTRPLRASAALISGHLETASKRCLVHSRFRIPTPRGIRSTASSLKSKKISGYHAVNPLPMSKTREKLNNLLCEFWTRREDERQVHSHVNEFPLPGGKKTKSLNKKVSFDHESITSTHILLFFQLPIFRGDPVTREVLFHNLQENIIFVTLERLIVIHW